MTGSASCEPQPGRQAAPRSGRSERVGARAFQAKDAVRGPKITVSCDGHGLVSRAGASLLAGTARVAGLGD
jgi:hypothetical protein